MRCGHRRDGCSGPIGLLVWLLLAAAACDRPHRRSLQPQAALSGETQPSLAPLVRLEASGRLEAPYWDRPFWRRAANDDPMDLAALANRVDAQTLLDVSLAGGRSGAVALRALAHSPTGYFMLGALCEQLPRFEPTENGLDAIEQILDRSSASGRELAEVVGVQPQCDESLSVLLKAPRRAEWPSLNRRRVIDLRRQFEF